MDTIATRQFLYCGDDGQSYLMNVYVEKPLCEEGSWRCNYRIKGSSYSFESKAWGEDSVQALLLALVALNLHMTTGEFKDRVTWLGMQELGLPFLDWSSSSSEAKIYISPASAI